MYTSATLKTWEWPGNEARLKTVNKSAGNANRCRICQARTDNNSLSHSRDVLCGEVDDGWYEVLPDENGSDGAPVSGGLTNQQADALHGHLHSLRRVGQGTNLNQLLLLD